MRDRVRVIEIADGHLLFEQADSYPEDPIPDMRDCLFELTGRRWQIERGNISTIKPSNNPLSSPALSLDRLRIRYDGGRYVSSNYAFYSPAFADTVPMALPGAGLGVAGAVYPTETTYIVAGMHDANGKRTTAGFDTFFGEGEYFTAVVLVKSMQHSVVCADVDTAIAGRIVARKLQVVIECVARLGLRNVDRCRVNDIS